MKNIIYTGVFFDAAHVAGTLANAISAPHVTFAFRHESCDLSMLGEKVVFTVVGYGNDSINEGYLVEMQAASGSIRAEFDKIAVPHITLSVADGGKPVDTAKLEFRPCKPFQIAGTFGAFVTGKGVVFSAPDAIAIPDTECMTKSGRCIYMTELDYSWVECASNNYWATYDEKWNTALSSMKKFVFAICRKIRAGELKVSVEMEEHYFGMKWLFL